MKLSFCLFSKKVGKNVSGITLIASLASHVPCCCLLFEPLSMVSDESGIYIRLYSPFKS